MATDMSLDLGHFANAGIEDFTQWLPQNDFQFDPQLFGGYRDPQENILSQGFDDSFFNDAVDIDFLTPYNLPIPSPAPPKKDLISQIDAAKDDDEPATGNMLLKCNEVWYVRPAPASTSCGLTNKLTGRRYRTAPRPRAAISTWTASAPICRKRPNATALVLWSARRTSSAPSRSISARRNSKRSWPM
jgi:hypothetical protein